MNEMARRSCRYWQLADEQPGILRSAANLTRGRIQTRLDGGRPAKCTTIFRMRLRWGWRRSGFFRPGNRGCGGLQPNKTRLEQLPNLTEPGQHIDRRQTGNDVTESGCQRRAISCGWCRGK